MNKTPEQKRIEELESMGVTEACAELPPVMEYFQQCEKRIEMLLEDCIEYCKRIEFLESQLAKCKRDAERYRWLKDNPDVGGLGWCVPDWEEYFTGDLDEAIDAAKQWKDGV